MPGGTYLYGRRMYETLAVWETDPTRAAQSELMADYASAWQAADKVVYSSTLAAPLTAKTRLERRFDPGAIRRRAGRRVGPVRLAGRPRWAQPCTADRLIDEHRFGSGVVHLRYHLR